MRLIKKLRGHPPQSNQQSTGSQNDSSSIAGDKSVLRSVAGRLGDGRTGSASSARNRVPKPAVPGRSKVSREESGRSAVQTKRETGGRSGDLVEPGNGSRSGAPAERPQRARSGRTVDLTKNSRAGTPIKPEKSSNGPRPTVRQPKLPATSSNVIKTSEISPAVQALFSIIGGMDRASGSTSQINGANSEVDNQDGKMDANQMTTALEFIATTGATKEDLQQMALVVQGKEQGEEVPLAFAKSGASDFMDQWMKKWDEARRVPDGKKPVRANIEASDAFNDANSVGGDDVSFAPVKAAAPSPRMIPQLMMLNEAVRTCRASLLSTKLKAFAEHLTENVGKKDSLAAVASAYADHVAGELARRGDTEKAQKMQRGDWTRAIEIEMHVILSEARKQSPNFDANKDPSVRAAVEYFRKRFAVALEEKVERR
ncbi:MAG: hypothetical protein EOO22_03330 [Comamonadaceae bacterium]|nr:MAG: hypothetical protein EOO22_03330 [Comamonadaceae bacterium]